MTTTQKHMKLERNFRDHIILINSKIYILRFEKSSNRDITCPHRKEKNPHFVDEVAALFGKDVHLIVGCNTGVRSRLSTKDLLDPGFKNVRNLKGGYQSFLRSENQHPAAQQ
ncbi:hypothetical protein E2562_038347 [Oryza meyeriana var. granulata]|uniref:Rhodanese domain-containing protein n=1 Tax=Oryza meyeriana var. granulata TaxID=110450 RepID=A0A6G1FGH6_9ORYZ|nr:hypothetical protein E2562_038347 [Oryza meyeriana var. granulata]